MSKLTPKPSPFSSLLSLKNRRLSDDTSAPDLSRETTAAAAIPTQDLANAGAGQPVAPDVQTNQAGDATGHSEDPDIYPTQAASSTSTPAAPDIQTGDITSHSDGPDIRTTPTAGRTTLAAAPDSQTRGTTEHSPTPNAPNTQALDDVERLLSPLQPDIRASAATGHPASPRARATRSSDVTAAVSSLAQISLGKRSHPDYTRMTVYIRKEVQTEFSLVTNLAREEMSEVVERLIADYAKARKQALVKTLLA